MISEERLKTEIEAMEKDFQNIKKMDHPKKANILHEMQSHIDLMRWILTGEGYGK